MSSQQHHLVLSTAVLRPQAKGLGPLGTLAIKAISVWVAGSCDPVHESSQAPCMRPPAVKQSRRVLVVRGLRFHKGLRYLVPRAGREGAGSPRPWRCVVGSL